MGTIPQSGEKSICTGTMGSIYELKATIWLQQLGYQVFRNMSPHGPADLVAWCPKSGETLMIDVKSINASKVRKDGQLTLSLSNKRFPGVHILLFVNGELMGLAEKTSATTCQYYWPRRAQAD